MKRKVFSEEIDYFYTKDWCQHIESFLATGTPHAFLQGLSSIINLCQASDPITGDYAEPYTIVGDSVWRYYEIK